MPHGQKKKTEQSNRSNIVTNLIETLKIVHTQKIYLKIKKKDYYFFQQQEQNEFEQGRKEEEKERKERKVMMEKICNIKSHKITGFQRKYKPE